VYSEVLRHIQSDYVVEPNIPVVTNGALRGLLESLDADSSYLTPADYETFKADKGGKAQVGIMVSKRFGYATVVSVVPGSPADRVNLGDGDILEAINGKDTRDISLAMIRLMLEGQPGTEMSVSVVRPRKTVPDKLTMTRVLVTEPAVSEQLYENSSILYVKPVTLDREHVQAVEAKLKSIERSGPRKVLLDLRDVSSGDYSEAVRLSNFFLRTGTIASLEGQKVAKVTYTADPEKSLDPSGPLVVLVNRGTAGPGELAAAALLENKRAELVGERTFGEGAQQKTFELGDGAALILSVAKYESPTGKKLQDEAVTPGVLVAGPQNAQDDGGDDTGDEAETTKPAPVVKPSVTVDDQLTKGLDLLKAKAA
jgi:carboxyl-terminal processing protease